MCEHLTFLIIQGYSKVTLPPTKVVQVEFELQPWRAQNHFMPMYEVSQDSCGSKQVVVLEFSNIKLFHEFSKLLLQALDSPLNLHTVPGMCLVVSC